MLFIAGTPYLVGKIVDYVGESERSEIGAANERGLPKTEQLPPEAADDQPDQNVYDTGEGT
jgi:hypothetical protein